MLKAIACPQCSKSFIITRPWQRFCSPKCRSVFHHKTRGETVTALRLRIKELEDGLA